MLFFIRFWPGVRCSATKCWLLCAEYVGLAATAPIMCAHSDAGVLCVSVQFAGGVCLYVDVFLMGVWEGGYSSPPAE